MNVPSVGREPWIAIAIRYVCPAAASNGTRPRVRAGRRAAAPTRRARVDADAMAVHVRSSIDTSTTTRPLPDGRKSVPDRLVARRGLAGLRAWPR